MKIFCTIALFVIALSVNALGQKTVSTVDWEISFGKASGRFLQDVVKQTVNSEGRITYSDKKNGTPAAGQISQTQVDEITGLLNRLNLPTAKAIPSTELNRCIVSMHMPNTFFSLSRNNKNYSLSHCNNFTGKGYQYTLNLSLHQKRMYKILREKIEALVSDKIKQEAATKGE